MYVFRNYFVYENRRLFMGDGKKLKEYLDEKGTNVRRIAKETGISATTLYTIIQKDSNIRFDFALRLLKNSLYPLMYLFGKNSMPDVDNLLTSFYQLDDEARKEVVETIQFKLQYHRDKDRAEQIKQIKGW